jgi:hypothetical protein
MFSVILSTLKFFFYIFLFQFFYTIYLPFYFLLELNKINSSKSKSQEYGFPSKNKLTQVEQHTVKILFVNDMICVSQLFFIHITHNFCLVNKFSILMNIFILYIIYYHII